MTKEEIIRHLKLTSHDEGGYFRQTYQSKWTLEISSRVGGTRFGLNTIYYMLTNDSPIGYFHLNRSDIIHFFHAGDPLTYLLITPNGYLDKRLLGPDPTKGHCLQIVVPGGTWKATVLNDQGSFGLLSEAVAPGFDYRDRELATADKLKELFPHLWDEIEPYVLLHSVAEGA